MAEIWFISDTHFHHKNIITFKNEGGEQIRPFSSIEEHDELIVERWNEVVRPEDHVYHLGDVTMERGTKGSPQAQEIIRWCRRLNGHKRLVLGNHDHFPVEVYVEAGFEKIRGMWQGFEGFVLSHCPIHPDSIGKRRACIHGHIHERLVMKSDHHPDERYLNVCVEHTKYRPLSLGELRERVGL